MDERDVVKDNNEIIEDLLKDLDFDKENKSDDKLELNSDEIIAGKSGEEKSDDEEIDDKEQSLEIDEFEKLYAITAARNE